MATPYTASSSSGVLTRTKLSGFFIVVKLTFLPAWPTVAVYVVPHVSGAAGTHDEPSGRRVPWTGVPLASARVTVVFGSAPASTTSAAAGTLVAPSAGAAIDSPCCPGVVPAACQFADVPEQPVSSAAPPSAAIAASTRAVVFNAHTPFIPDQGARSRWPANPGFMPLPVGCPRQDLSRSWCVWRPPAGYDTPYDR